MTRTFAKPWVSCRYLRVLATGANSSNEHKLAVAGFEVYSEFMVSV